MDYRSGGEKSVAEIQGGKTKLIPTGVKRLLWDKLQKKRKKGLFFNFDEKFIPGHHCKVKQAFLIEPVDNIEGEEMEESGKDNDPKISVHAMAGTRGPKTMHLGSWIKKRRVIVLVDNGPSYNSINEEIAKKLQLKATTMEPFQVQVAYGERLTYQELYGRIPIRIQGVTITIDLFALPLEGLDVVLGVQWLESLGRVVTDCRRGLWSFYGEMAHGHFKVWN